MGKIIAFFHSKVGIVTAVAGVFMLAGLLFILPRALNIGHADVCNGAPDGVDFNHFPVTYIGEACKDFPAVTLRNVNGQYPQSQGEFDQGLSAQAGNEIYVRLWVHNGAVTNGETADNVSINVNVPSAGPDHVISANISASNDHGRGASGAETLHTASGETLQIVPGTVEVFDNQGNPLGLPSGFTQTGPSSFSFDHLPACFEFAKFIRFKVKVVATTAQESFKLSENPAQVCVNSQANFAITQATPGLIGKNIYWSSTKNGADTGEDMAFYNQTVDGSGSWNGSGTYDSSMIGHWVKTATIGVFGPSQSVSFDVVDCAPAQGPKTFTLTTNGQFCVGDTPLYTITGTANLIGLSIYWSSTLNNQPTGENNTYIGQTTTNAQGLAFWSDYGGTWQGSHIGSWTKTATIDGVTNTVSFIVKDCSPAQAKNFTLTATPQVCVGQNTQYTITGTPNLANLPILWTSTFNGQNTGENNAYVGQTFADQNGLAFWTDVGSTWQSNQAGQWSKTATIDGISKTVSFTVKDCSTPLQPVVCSPLNQNAQTNQVVYVTASGGSGSYNFSAPGGVNGQQNSNSDLHVTYPTAGVKTITVTSGSQSASCNVSVQAQAVPALVCSPVAQNAQIGQTVYFTATGGSGNYQWSSPGGSQVIGAGQTYFTSFGSSGSRQVTVTDGSQSAPCNVTVQPQTSPTLVCSPFNQTAQVNQTVYFTAFGGDNNFSWSAPGASQAAGSGSSFTTAYAAAGSKTVTVTSGGKTADCNVTVIATPPPQLVCSPANQTADINQTVYFTAFGGSGSFAWQAPGSTQASGSGQNFTTTYSASGNQTVTLSSGGQSATCLVFVRAPVTQTLQCSPANQTVDPGQPAYLTAVGGNGSYSWSASGGSPLSGSGMTFSTAFSGSGAHTVTVQSGGQTATCNVQVNNVSPQPKSFTLIANNFCVGQQPRYTITSTANLIGLPINWTSTGPGSAAGSIVAGTVTADGNGLGFWSDIGAPWTASQIGTWTKTASIDGITKSVTFAVVDCNPVQPVPLVCAPSSQTAQTGQVVYFTATGGNGSYSWSAPGANQSSGNGQSFNTSYNSSGAHTVVVSSAGVSATCNVVINPVQVQTLICAPGSQSVNVGQTASFVASGGNGSYSWSAPGSNQVSGTSQSFTASYNGSGNQVVTVTSGGQTATCNVTINQVTQPQLLCSPPNQTAQINQNVYFSASGGNGSYYWSLPGANQSSAFGSSVNTAYAGGGTYVATVSSGNQTATCQVQIINNPPPQLLCSPAFQNVNVGQTVWFTAIGGNGSYTWSTPGASQTFGNGQSFNTTYASAGNFSATVNSNGQTATCNVFVQGQVAGSNVNLVFSKRAINETKNADATQVNASKEDYITYTLMVTNTGNAPATNFVITDDLSGVLPFADMVDNGGGTLNGNVIGYPAINVPAGGSVSKSFKVRVKFFLADNLSYTMTNTYGNTVVVHINTPQVKGTFIAPKTGADTGAFAFAGVLTAGFALFRKRKFILSAILN